MEIDIAVFATFPQIVYINGGMMPFIAPRASNGRSRLFSAPVAIVLCIGIAASVAIAYTIRTIEIRRTTIAFQRDSEQTINSINDRIDSQIDLLRSIVSLFNSSSNVRRSDFQSFVEDSLKRHPSIQVVGWVPRVSAQDRVRFEAFARENGFENYRINERTADRRPIPAGERAEYFPNLFLQPAPANANAYGLDQASDPIRRAALELARDTGRLVFSERIELALVAENRTAIAVYAPIYSDGGKSTLVNRRRENLRGFAVGIVRPAQIIESMFYDGRRSIDPKSGTGLRIDVFDTSDPTKPQPLFSYPHAEASAAKMSDGAIVVGNHDFLTTANFGGRQWTFVSRPASGILAGDITLQTGFAFGACLMMSLLLAAYLHTVLNRARAIEAEVDSRTNELRLANSLLRDSEDRIRAITDSIPAMIAYVDQNLIYRFANRRYHEIGIDPETMIGRSMRDVRGDEAYEKVRHHYEKAAAGEAVKFDVFGSDRDGISHHHSIECNPDIFNGEVRGFYILARDVTLQRNAENEARRATQLLRESEDRIRGITNSVPALIAYLDRDLVYRFANRRYSDIGLDPEALVGKPLTDLLGDGSYEIMRPYFERAARGEAVSFEISPSDKYGRTGYRMLVCTPDIVDGEVRGFYVLGHDITEQRKTENEIFRANELLRSSEERLRIITNSLPALIAHVDHDMNVQYANDRFGILNENNADIVGSPLKDVIGPTRFEDLRIACERALLGEPSQLEISVSRQDGQKIYILIDITPDVAINGSVRGFYFVALNVTAQRAVEIELDRFFRQSVSFMCVATYDGFLRRFNDTWNSALGYSEDELISTPYVDFIHAEDRSKMEAALKRLETESEIANLEFRMVCKDGSERHVLWNVAANLNDRQIYATGHDITELKAVDRMKEEFVSTVSHELRTPLTSIKGALGLMRAKTFGTLSAEMNTMLEIAYKNCDRLVLLINDILDIEKIEAGKMDFRLEPIDLVVTVRNALAANQAYGDQFGVTFSMDTDLPTAMVRADEGRIMQVMANLLSNAAKFSPENGRVIVGVYRSDKSIRISVRDDGPGIPEDFRSRIFEKFSQHDSSDRRKISGTGLGLSIVRAIVERHGGKISFTTAVDKGTTFQVDLPDLTVAIEPRTGEKHKYRILICEDDADIATVISGIIENCGYAADIALNAADASALLNRHTYAGMTLDLVLPDMSGIEFFKQLRSDSRTHLLPIIIVSAKATESIETINGNAINVVDWLNKPFDEKRLAKAVRSAIAMSSNSTQRILHIEDDPDIVQIVAGQIGLDIACVSAGSIVAAKQLLGHEEFDLVILDLILPDGRGEELLPLMRNPDGGHIPVVIFSALEVSRELAQRVEAVLIKTRSTDQMLVDAIENLIIRHNFAPKIDDNPNITTGKITHG